VPDLRWDQVSEFFNPDLMGSLPDLFIPEATVHDWQTVLDLVTTSGWQWRFEIGAVEQPLQTTASIFARGTGAETAELRVWHVSGVLAIFRCWSETEISFDVDLRELQGQQGADVLCVFLRAIGSRLGKPVLMTPEGGSQEHLVLGYDPDLGKVTLR
jgi:hypothetical protein